MNRELRVLELGRSGYAPVWALQKKLVESRAALSIPDHLILVEHPDTVTLGRQTPESAVLSDAFPVHRIERGGLATYHGPGQLVGYPILHLKELGIGVGEHLRRLETALIEALSEFGLRASRREGLTGVWLGARKVASIGVAVRRWVSYHGFALNVSTDLSKFREIVPCGMPAETMTSMGAALGAAPDFNSVQDAVLERLRAVYMYESREVCDGV